MTQRSVSRRSGTSKLLVFLVAAGLLICFASISSAGTTKVYQGLNMQMPYVTGVYQLGVGPVNVSAYTNIRVNAFGNSGSGTVQVTVAAVDKQGVETLGVIDNFTIDFSSAYFVSRTYIVPGQYVKFYFQSNNPDYVSLVIFGR